MHRALAIAVAAPLLAGAVWLLAPSALGGRTDYAIVHGSSMEPKLDRGDLVLIRDSGSYEVGDVVAYDSATLGSTVLHRIMERQGSSLVLKGDNNDFVDADTPTDAEVQGELWVHVPRAGALLEWAREPRHAAIVGGLAALLAAGGRAGATRRRRGRFGTGGRLARAAGGDAALVVAGVGLLLAVTAFTRPATITTEREAYRHTGAFGYSATAPRGSAVYGRTRVTTGEPLYTALVRSAKLTFRYALDAPAGAGASGTASLAAVVRGADGWSRTLTLAAPRAFAGGRVVLRGTIDLAALQALTREVAAVTGTPNSTYTVAVRATVRVSGATAGTTTVDTFAPSIGFQLTPAALQLQRDAVTGEPAAPLTPIEAKTAPAAAANAIRLGPVALPVVVARLLALALLALGGLAYAVSGLSRRRRGEDVTAIARSHGDRIVRVQRLAPTVRIAEVAAFEELMRLAEAGDRVVLHAAHDGGDVYAVEDGEISYRFRNGVPTDDPDFATLAVPHAGARR